MASGDLLEGLSGEPDGLLGRDVSDRAAGLEERDGDAGPEGSDVMDPLIAAGDPARAGVSMVRHFDEARRALAARLRKKAV